VLLSALVPVEDLAEAGTGEWQEVEEEQAEEVQLHLG
jgi:hypothetical protein